MKDYTKIPNEILSKSNLTIQERYLYCLLLKHCGKDDKCFPSQKTLGEIMGMSRRHVRNILCGLIAKTDILTWKRRGWNRSNTYMVSKDLTVDRKNNTYHLRTVLPLHIGNDVPPKSTYLKGKGKRNLKGFENYRRALVDKGLIK